MEIAFQENSRISQADLAFKIAAVNRQMREDLAPAYLEEPWPCNSYKSLVGLPAGTFWAISVLDDIDAPGAAGFHDYAAGLAYGRVRASADPLDATCESHEAAELWADPRCSIWIPMPDGRFTAREICDACEADRYDIEVTIGAETRRIWVSDFLLPAWFVSGAPRPYTFLDSVDEPFGLSRNGGGYRLVREQNGNISSDFGRHSPFPVMRNRMAKKIADPLSRTARRGLR
jgi:hypothetical protein